MKNRIFFKGDIKVVCKELNRIERHNRGITLCEYIQLLQEDEKRRETIFKSLENYQKNGGFVNE